MIIQISIFHKVLCMWQEISMTQFSKKWRLENPFMDLSSRNKRDFTLGCSYHIPHSVSPQCLVHHKCLINVYWRIKGKQE